MTILSSTDDLSIDCLSESVNKKFDWWDQVNLPQMMQQQPEFTNAMETDYEDGENGETKPKMVAKYAIVAVASGAKINGIINNGFKTIGQPNMIGSSILKIPGASANLPIVLWSARLENITIVIDNIKVTPAPPGHTNASNEPATHL